MGTLYQLTDEFLEIQELLQNEEIDPSFIDDTLESLIFELEQKADGYAQVRKNVFNDINIIKEEEKRLKNRRLAYEKNLERLDKAIEKSMIVTGKTNIKTSLFTYQIRTNPPSVVIDDEEQIPNQFRIEQPSKIDKSTLKDFLKKHKTPYAHLEQSKSLKIR